MIQTGNKTITIIEYKNQTRTGMIFEASTREEVRKNTKTNIENGYWYTVTDSEIELRTVAELAKYVSDPLV